MSDSIETLAPALPSRGLLLGTAFLEGMAVLTIEIAGARALAPFFGTTLQVWTAQITATLLFLALGYATGGWLARRRRAGALPAAFGIAGSWLVALPFLRTPVLESTVAAGIAAGSFLSAAALYGPPLLALGAVSPLLIERLDQLRPGAGSAAGTLFFVNTVGGIAGGWLTALWLIPAAPLRLVLAGTGGVLLMCAVVWTALQRRRWSAAVALVALGLAIGSLAVGPRARVHFGTEQVRAHVVYRRQSRVGLVQVIDFERDGPPGPLRGRILLLDGVSQGGIDRDSGLSLYGSVVFQDVLAHRYHPRARSALLLGLGCGLTGRRLAARGVSVTAVELDRRVGDIARSHFGFPSSAVIHLEDARTYINRGPRPHRFDLIFLDVFAGETVPWHLTTVEALTRIRALLSPGGLLIVNTLADAFGESTGLARIESTLARVFPQATVHLGPALQGEALRNATLLAGDRLRPTAAASPGRISTRVARQLPGLLSSRRGVIAGGPVGTDDWHDLDHVDTELRAAWRRQILSQFGAAVLSD